jgi:hypothetical protein
VGIAGERAVREAGTDGVPIAVQAPGGSGAALGLM